MMRIYYALFSLLLCLPVIFSGSGCTGLRNEVNPGQLGLESAKLVVSGFLSPQDTVVAVKVTRSATVVGDSVSVSLFQTGNNIPDATVTITEGTRILVLRYNNALPTDSTQAYYQASARSFPIRVGRTYTLTVVTANGQRASSSCTIPKQVPLSGIAFDSLTEIRGRFQSRRYFVEILWQDPAAEANYYQVAGYFRYTTQCASCPVEQSGDFPVSFNDDKRGLFSDVGTDGTLTISGRAFLTSSSLTAGQPGSFYNQYKTARVTMNLMSVDQAYYRYQDAINRQRRSRNNPFAEPVPIPSNIEGGLGCFAGYNNATQTLVLK